MPGQFFVRKIGNALVPASLAAQIALDKLKPGQSYKVAPKQPRNQKQHRLFWAFVTYVADALNDGPAGAHWDADGLKDDLLIATGFATLRKMTEREMSRYGLPRSNTAKIAVQIMDLMKPFLGSRNRVLSTAATAVLKLAEKLAATVPEMYVARPKSISFSAMDGQEFSAFMNAAFLYVRDDLAPWIEDSPHWGKIETILAESWLGNEREGDAA